MLRVNNIDVDGLYEKGCLHMEPKAKKMSVLGDHIVEEDTRNFMKDPEKERGKNIFDNYVTNWYFSIIYCNYVEYLVKEYHILRITGALYIYIYIYDL